MKITRLFVIAVAATLLLAACGDSDGGGDADPALVAALADELASPDDDGSPSPFPRDDAECAAEKIISGIGAGRLAELGVTADDVGEVEELDFTDSELDTIVDSLGDCSDLPRLMADQLAADGALSAEDADCFADEFDEGLLKDVFKGVFQGEELGDDPPEDFLNAFIDVAAECDFSF